MVAVAVAVVVVVVVVVVIVVAAAVVVIMCGVRINACSFFSFYFQYLPRYLTYMYLS